MSFDYDPYRHIEVLQAVPDGPYELHCHSCGKTWGNYDKDTTIKNLFIYMATHVRVGHDRTPADFSTWSYL